MQKATNHQYKVYVLYEIEVTKNYFKISINTERNLKETRTIAAIKQNPKYFGKFEKSNSTIKTGIGNLETCNKKMSKLLNTKQFILYS